jgi:hypothetical protein
MCGSEDINIVLQHKAAAETRCLKGPTPVKDHNASAVAMESQHKMLKKILESFGRGPDIFPLLVTQVSGLYQ